MTRHISSWHFAGSKILVTQDSALFKAARTIGLDVIGE
jgi:hypothetical protein